MPSKPVTLEPHRLMNRLPGWICLVITAIAVHTCLRIEWLNWRAGGFLPRAREEPVEAGFRGNPKWRVASERSVRAAFQNRVSLREYERRVAAGDPTASDVLIARERNPRPLTAIEESELELELDHNRANLRLRDWVQTAGLAQYLVAPFAFIMSVALLIRATGRRARLRYGLLVMLSGGSIGMTLYRGYFTSLGW